MLITKLPFISGGAALGNEKWFKCLTLIGLAYDYI